MKTVSLKLPDDLHAKLAHLSQKRSAAKSEVVRAALEAYFASAGDGSPSCADLASDLIGSATGPKDLATNPKHMRGYGQWKRASTKRAVSKRQVDEQSRHRR